MNKDLDCCTHYNRQGYYTGYVMLPVFRVRICRSCGEVHAEWSRAANLLFMGLFRWFWSGKDVYKRQQHGFADGAGL